MAYARQGPPGGYGQQPRGPPQGAPSGYQYDDPSQSQSYGYGSNGGGGGYADQGYEEPAPVAYHGKARYYENPPPTRNFEDHGGYGQQGGGYDQRGYDHGGYDQSTHNQGGHAQDGYGQAYQQDDRYAQPAGPAGGGGYDQNYGNYQHQHQHQHQQRPPPQRPGHGGPTPQPDARQHQAPGRPMNDRPPPTRQYTDGPRPSTSGGSSMSRGQSNESGRRPEMPPNNHSSKPRGPGGPVERPLQNQPNSPQNMAWDNPFGSFGNVAAPKEKSKPKRDEQQQRPSTSHSSSSHRHQHNGQRPGESSRSHQRPPQGAHEERPPPQRQEYGQQGYSSPPGAYNQSSGRGPPPQQHDAYNNQAEYAGQGPVPQQPQPQRNFTPNFSRVQSPPIRNGQTPPNMGIERSNTMPADLPVRTVNSSTPTAGFTADLPFREGRAQTPTYASPQYAEAQSAVIESVSDQPNSASDWNDDGGAHGGYHQTSHSMHDPGQQGNGYGDFYDDYYGSQQNNGPASPPGGGDFDMPNFGTNRGNDELHLDSGTPTAAPMRTAYGQEPPPPQGQDYQNHGFDFGTNGQPAGGNGYGAYGANDPADRSFSSAPPQGQQGYPGGRGAPPPGRGMPPPGRGGYPPNRGRGGPPGPLDRSATAPPGQRPNGAPYGPPGPNGRGGPPPARGRGGPGGPGGPGFAGDARGPMQPGQGPGPGPGGRGGPPGPRGRGGPPGPGAGPGRGQPPPDSSAGHHPAPVRPGLMQQGGGAAKPPPVRQYTSPPNAGQPPNSYGGPPPPEAAEGPVTMGEIQKLRMTIADNPGDQTTTLILVKKLVEASTVLAGEDGRADPKTKAKNREKYINDAYKHLKKLCSYSNKEAMFYMAECQGSGQLGLQKDPKEAFLLYQSAAKLGHAPSCYRVAVCCELGESEGGGTKRDPLKAMQWYQRAATLGDLPAMYKLGVILLKGLLGQNPQPGEAVNWLQRAADRADPDNPHALHELGLLYEAPPAQVQNKVFPDANYSFELFSQAAALGYKFSQYRLGQCYEYGQLGCPIDARQSIAWYSKAAVQEEHQSELALSGWYLTGTEGVIQQSDTEAYLWARKAAQAGLAKAEYAMGYFTETGIGCSANLEDAKRWYWRASAQNFPKARERLEDLRRGGAKATQTRVSRSTMQKNQGDCKPM